MDAVPPADDPLSTPSRRQQKLAQTERQFLHQLAAWHPRDDIALARARLTLPRTCPPPASTPQTLKARAEQEYYLRRYADALCSAREALSRMEARPEAETRELRELRELARRCERRMRMGTATGAEEEEEGGAGTAYST
ncbi:hypothetical protein EV426DRAFT_575470 [Tirmania nivea]|nr:hypothetical protein EV426DRAFT_575470 [Tirmania nivea]